MGSEVIFLAIVKGLILFAVACGIWWVMSTVYDLAVLKFVFGLSRRRRRQP